MTEPSKLRRIMQSIRKTNSKPELHVRSALHRLGYRFRLHRRDLPGVPDVVLPRHRTVVLVHGCFWHQHDCRLGRKQPSTNQGYWLPKLRRNVQRDRVQAMALRNVGWRVVIIWECETKPLSSLASIVVARMSE